MKIILIRHAKTGKDKTNPNREITFFGRIKTLLVTQKLKKQVFGKACIICPPVLRNIQTGRIVSRVLHIPLIAHEELICPIKNIRMLKKTSDQLTSEYILLNKKSILPLDIESLESALYRIRECIKKYEYFSYDCVIFIVTASIADIWLELLENTPQRLGYSQFFVL